MNDLINLHDILKGLPGISAAKAEFLHEGCVICLDGNSHSTLKTMVVSGLSNSPLDLQWSTQVTDQMRRTWEDQQEATEHGAECIAVLMSLKLTDYTVVRRSRKGTGIDYWLGYKNDQLFQDAARLEVSGIFCGDDTKIASRVKQKLSQTNQSGGHGSLPAYVCIVEFGKPHAVFQKR
jgi:hypothetical protein